MSIFIWLILIGCFIWFVKYAVDQNIFNLKSLDPKNRAFALLKKRYANGEIEKQEYEDKKRNLEL